jgi:hypothetical protein
VLDAVMSAVDDIAIMAYRTSAYGADGALTHSLGEVSLARETGVGVFIGVETTRIDDEVLYTFRGEGRTGMPELRDAAWILIEDLGGDLGEDRIRVWLADGEEALADVERRVDDVSALRYWFAGRPVPLQGDRLSFQSLGARAMDAVTDQIVRHLGDDPAFLGLAYHDYRGLSELLDPR